MSNFQPLTPRRFRIYNSAYRGLPRYVPHESWILYERGHGEDDTLRVAASHAELVDFLDDYFRFEHLWEKVHGPMEDPHPTHTEATTP